METAYRFLLAVHGAVGAVALMSFWIAAFAKKGASLHRAVGKVYLIAMCGIVATAAPMSVMIGVQGKTGTAIFLAYLVVVTSTSMWVGWRAIRRKRDQARFRDTRYAAVGAANVLASAVVFAVGLKSSSMLLMGFSAVGFLVGGEMLLHRVRPKTEPRWWLEEHFGAMVGCGVATHIAFLSIGLDRLIRAVGIDPPDGYGLTAWFLPLSLAFVAMTLLRRKYMPKTGAATALREA